MADAMMDKVREYAAEIEAQGKSPAYAFATAWARACKYHPELDEQAHCQRQGRQYLTLTKNQRLLRTLHRLCLGMPRAGEVMYWAAMALGIRTQPYVAVRQRQRQVILKYARDLYAPGIDDVALLELVVAASSEADLGASPPAAIERAVDGVVAQAGGVQNPRSAASEAWVASFPAHHFDRPPLPSTEVRAHFNLHTGGYSVDTKGPDGWRMRDDDIPALTLTNATFEYLPSKHRKYVETGKRDVHAWVYGTEDYTPPRLDDGVWRPCHYSKDPPCFLDRATKKCLPNDGTVDVYLASASNIDPATGKPRKSIYSQGRALPWRPDAWWRPAKRANPRPITRAAGALFDLPPARRSVAAPPPGFEDWLVTDTSTGADWVTKRRATYYVVRSPRGQSGTLIPHGGVYRFHEQLDLFSNPRRNPEQLLTGDVRPMPDGGLGVLTYDVVKGRRKRVWVPAPNVPDWRRDLARPPRMLRQPEGLRPGSSPLARRRGNLTVSEAVLPDGSRIDVAWEIVDLSDLVVSHDPWDLTVNKQYPQDLQPRERSRKSYGDQISRLVAQFNPVLLTWSATVSDGAPIIGPDNVVESGNGRTMALSRVYRAGGAPADEYRATVATWAKELGIPMPRAKEPVLVRRRLSKVDRAEFARSGNVSAMQLMSAGEQAAADAAQMPANLVLALNPEAGLGTLANAAFAEQFIAQVAGRAARGAMLDKSGKLSKAGQARIDLALFAFAYGQEAGVLINELAEVRESDLRTTLAGMLEAVVAVARTRAGMAAGLYDAALDPAHSLVELALFVRAAKLAGQTIDERLRQRDLVGELSDLGRLWLRALRPKGRLSAASLADAIIAYCQWVTLYPVNQTGLFGEEAPSIVDLVDRAVTTGAPAEGPA